MFGMSLPDSDQLQGTLVDFALVELIRQHRLSFQPLWTVDSWAKLMIWLALNCGLSSDKENFEHFAQSLGERIIKLGHCGKFYATSIALNHQKLKASQILQKIPIQKLGPWWLEKKFQLNHNQN